MELALVYTFLDKDNRRSYQCIHDNWTRLRRRHFVQGRSCQIFWNSWRWSWIGIHHRTFSVWRTCTSMLICGVNDSMQYSFAYPLLAAMILSLLNAVYIIAILPESRNGERKPFQWKKSNPFHSFNLIGQQKLVLCIMIALFVLQTGEWGKLIWMLQIC